MNETSRIEVPRVIRESSSGYQTFSILDEMLRCREVECVGVINADSVYSLCRQLRHLEREDPQKPITMFINSPGGSVTDGLALYDVMVGISCPVRTVCLGSAASMGAFLFAAGDQRDILPHGRVMIHDPLIEQTGGSALELSEISRRLMQTRQYMAQLLSEFTGRTLEEIYEKTRRDAYFSAEEAVAFGLADRVISRIGTAAVEKKTRRMHNDD